MDIKDKILEMSRKAKKVNHDNCVYEFNYQYSSGLCNEVTKDSRITLKFELKRSVNYYLICNIFIDGEKYIDFKTDLNFMNKVNFILVQRSVKEKKVIKSKFNYKASEIFKGV